MNNFFLHFTYAAKNKKVRNSLQDIPWSFGIILVTLLAFFTELLCIMKIITNCENRLR